MKIRPHEIAQGVALGAWAVKKIAPGSVWELRVRVTRRRKGATLDLAISAEQRHDLSGPPA